MITGYFLVWLIFYTLFKKSIFNNIYVSNAIGFWGLLVIVPFLYFRYRGYRWRDFGLSPKNYRRHFKLAFIAGLLVGIPLLFLTPGGKFILSQEIGSLQLIKTLLISFLLALFLAAFFEEFFFRALLQTRLTQYFKSHITGILIAPIIFGLYHFPFQYYGNGTAAGDYSYALANVLNEQMVSAPILGILWARTNNLIAPVFVHTIKNTISGAERISIMLGY